MKKFKIILILLVLNTGFSQENNYSVSVSRFNSWTFLNFNLHHKYKNNFEIYGGLGLSCSQFLYSYKDLGYHKSALYAENFAQIFTVNYGLRKYFNLGNENLKLYVSLSQSLGYSAYRFSTSAAEDSIVYIQTVILPAKLYCIQNLNLGYVIQVNPKLSLSSQVGFNYLIREGMRGPNLIFELGIRRRFGVKEE